MIKFEIKNQKTGKKESYSKELITMGEAENFYAWMEKRESEAKKDEPNVKKMRQMEREFFVSLFSEQGLTEEDILNNMGTKQYSKALEEVFQEISGEDGESEENEEQQEGKTENPSQ